MGRYQVIISKTPALCLEINGYVEDFTGKVIHENNSPFVKLSSVSFEETTAQYVKIESRTQKLVNKDRESGTTLNEGQLDQPTKVIEVLHTGKIAGKTVNAAANGIGDDERSVKKNSRSEFKCAIIDVSKIRDSERYAFDCFIDDQGVEVRETRTDNNGNMDKFIVSEGSSESMIPTGTGEIIITEETTDENENPESAEEMINAGAVMVSEPEENPTNEIPKKFIPITSCFDIGNDLIITVIMESYAESRLKPILDRREVLELLQENLNLYHSSASLKPVEQSNQSFAVSEMLFNVPYQELFEDELSRARMHPEVDSNTVQRHERKQLIKRLILQRLIALGLPNSEAHNITDTWNNGYVQHRALSYRIPKIRSKAVPTRNLENFTGPKLKPKPFSIETVERETDRTGTPRRRGFIENFLYHAQSCQGILNSATCTLLESMFFLMIPHFKPNAENRGRFFPGSGINPEFIQQWIELMKIAAFQLRPDDPPSVQPLIRKELKALRNVIDATEKLAKKMKEKLNYLSDKTDILKKKMHSKIKSTGITPEWAQTIEKQQEPKNYNGFAHLQMVGFSAPNLFHNFLYMQTGRFGLFIKRTASDVWFPYSDLNFLERRVIFLGIMDHMKSSFEAVQSTLRHLEELYTPGYPMSLLQKIRPLFELLQEDHPYQLLADDSKTQMYSLACGLVGAISRFKFVFKELKKMIRDAKDGIHNVEINGEISRIFNESRLAKDKKIPKIMCTVPFTTYPLERFENLKERGIQFTMSEPGSFEPPEQETETPGTSATQ